MLSHKEGIKNIKIEVYFPFYRLGATCKGGKSSYVNKPLDTDFHGTKKLFNNIKKD